MQAATRLTLFAALLVLLGGLIYWQGLAGPLFFDDGPALTGNELVQLGTELGHRPRLRVHHRLFPARDPQHVALGGPFPWCRHLR